MSPSSAQLLLTPETRVTCPHCEREFALADGFARKALEGVEEESAAALASLREQERLGADRHAQKIAAERDAAHAQALTEVRALTVQSLAPQIDALKAQLTASQAKIADMDAREATLVANERQGYEKRIAEQDHRLQAFQAEQLGLREERQRLQDEKAAMALDVQRQVDARVAERDSIVRRQEQEKSTLEKAELQKKIDDMAGKLAEAQAKASQGSQQLQGEVLELAIEEGLRRSFPLDTIAEVKKGQRGGDVLQHVMTRTGQAAGIILWETKRARDWSPQWITKLREDMRGCGAEVGVLITMPTAIPKEWQAGQLFALHEDVWVTLWTPALQLATALRAALVDIYKQKVISAGKGEHMEAVYDYLTSPQFAQKLKAVYEAFNKMREELESERNSTLQRWARREKQLQVGMSELLGVAGELQGLAHHGMAALELELQHDRLSHDP
jgi:hypothetical protein